MLIIEHAVANWCMYFISSDSHQNIPIVSGLVGSRSHGVSECGALLLATLVGGTGKFRVCPGFAFQISCDCCFGFGGHLQCGCIKGLPAPSAKVS